VLCVQVIRHVAAASLTLSLSLSLSLSLHNPHAVVLSAGSFITLSYEANVPRHDNYCSYARVSRVTLEAESRRFPTGPLVRTLPPLLITVGL